MKASELKSEILAAFLIGTARRRPDYTHILGDELPGGVGSADLKVAALLAQALRLERPAARHEFEVERKAQKRRSFLPEELRAPFVRLFGAGKSALPPQDDLALGMAVALERRFLAPHPYDFHRLEGFLRAHADRLGADALDWLDRDKAVQERQSYFDLAVITDDNWTEATPARRERYINERRRADPATARALVEAVWASETADMRLRLLGPLSVRLEPDDRAFLEGLAKDRAPKVRDLAAFMLGRLPGPDGEQPAHQEALARITRGTAGLFRKKTVLKVELPATVANDTGAAWVFKQFSDIAIDTCLIELGMVAGDVIEAAREDPMLLAAITVMAANSRRFDLVAEVAAISEVPLGVLGAGGFSAWAEFSPDEAHLLVAAVFHGRPALKNVAMGPVLNQLYTLTRGVIPVGVFDALAHEVERRWDESTAIEHRAMLTPLALLAPAAGRAAVRSLAHRLEEAGDPVIAWLELLDRIERVSTHE